MDERIPVTQLSPAGNAVEREAEEVPSAPGLLLLQGGGATAGGATAAEHSHEHSHEHGHEHKGDRRKNLGVAEAENFTWPPSTYYVRRQREGDSSSPLLLSERYDMSLHDVERVARGGKLVLPPAGEEPVLRSTDPPRLVQHVSVPSSSRAGSSRTTGGGGRGGSSRGQAPASSAPGIKDVFHLEQSREHGGSYQILVRSKCVIVAFPTVGALICREQGLLFQEGMDSDRVVLEKILGSEQKDRDTFEYIVLTGLLDLMHRDLTRELEKLKGLHQKRTKEFVEQEKTISLMDSLTRSSHYKELSIMLGETKALLAKITAATTCLDTLHGNQDDVEGLVVSLDKYPPATQQEGEVEESEEWLKETKEMEELLEWSYGTLMKLEGRANGEITLLESAMERVRVSLDTQQNDLTMFQIKVQLVTMALGLCSAISGFFGMNLSNGWCGPEGCSTLGTTDAGRGGFTIVIYGSVALAVTATLAFYYVISAKFFAHTYLYFAVTIGLLLCLVSLKSLNVYYMPLLSGW